VCINHRGICKTSKGATGPWEKTQTIPNPKMEIICIRQSDQIEVEISYDIKMQYLENSRQKTM